MTPQPQNDSTARLQSLLELCATPSIWGNKDEIAILGEAIALAKTSDETLLQAQTVFLYAEYLCRIGNYSLAAEFYEQAEKLYQRVPAVEGVMLCALGLIDVAWNTSQIKLADEKLGELMEAVNKLSNSDITARALLLKTKILHALGMYKEELEVAAEAVKLFEACGDAVGLGYTVIQISVVKQVFGEYEQSEKDLKLAETLHSKVGNKFGVSTCLSGLGYNCYFQGNYSAMVDYCTASLALETETGNRKGMALSCIRLGLAQKEFGNYAAALEYQLQALQMLEEMGVPGTMSAALNNIAAIYLEQRNYDEAMAYNNRALAIREKLGDKNTLASTHNTIGNVWFNKENYGEALKSFETALALREEIGDKWGIAWSCGDIGDVFEMQQNYNEALKYISRALSIQREIGEKRGTAVSLGRIGKIYAKLGDTANAFNYLEQALALSKELGSKEITVDMLSHYVAAYRAMGDFENALKYFEQQLQLEREIMGERTQKQLTDLRFQNDLQQKEKQLEIEQLARKSEEEKNRLLSREKELIQQSLEEKDMLLREIHHRVKNNLEMISSLLEIHSATLTDEGAKKALVEGQSRVQSIALIHQRLYQRENVAEVELKTFADDLYKQVATVFITQGQQVKFNNNLQEQYFDIDTAVPLGLMMNELFSNAFKYAFKAGQTGTLSILLSKGDDEFYSLQVSDNGPGMPADYDFKKSKSLGMRLLNVLSKQLHGSAANANSQGAIFTIRFKDTITRKKVN